MICAIMQPCYLPWSGYFNLISRANKFVFLDNVQFEKQSWQSRNRILLQGKEHLLAVPVARSKLDTPIYRIVIDQRTLWQKKHWRTLQGAYQKAPHGSSVLDMLEPYYTKETPETLSEFNQAIIRCLAQTMKLATDLFRSSELACDGGRTERLINICKCLGCDEYLSPEGAREYLNQDSFAERSGIKLSFQDFKPSPYPQYGSSEFISHLSIVDVMANQGVDRAVEYIRAPHV